MPVQGNAAQPFVSVQDGERRLPSGMSQVQNQMQTRTVSVQFVPARSCFAVNFAASAPSSAQYSAVLTESYAGAAMLPLRPLVRATTATLSTYLSSGNLMSGGTPSADMTAGAAAAF
eukprot:1068976-Rhodomonas_salina.1